jgi:hypothetical protein
MRYHVTRPPLRRMMMIDRDMRARNWRTDKLLALNLEFDPRTIRRDLGFMRDQYHTRSRTTGLAEAIATPSQRFACSLCS